MIASILATAVCVMAVPAPSPVPADSPHSPSTVHQDDRALKALAAWLKLYESGKINIYSTEYVNRVPPQIDWREQQITAKQSFAVKFGLAPKSGLAESTWLSDLKVIAEEVANTDTPAAAVLLVELAAVGLDQQNFSRAQAPHMVRAEGERWIARLKDPAARAEVARIAGGELKPDRGRITALQGAALRGLAAFRDASHRAAIESQIGNGDPLLRFHAAEALGRLADAASVPALIGALERETSDIALPAIVDALRSIYGTHATAASNEGADDGSKAPKTAPESARLAVRAAMAALGRTSWRGDMALLRLLDDVRTKDAIPALIGVLELYRDNPDQLRSGKLSTLVQHRAHELLVSMTGAVFPASEPQKWRDLWEQEQDKIDVAQRHAAPSGGATTVASGFCGIPVEGSRVIFILDLSRSMTFPMGKKGGTTAGDSKPTGANRMDYARRELHAAIDSMGDNTAFNLITFDGNEEAATWSKKLLPATDKNREKLKKYIDGREPDGGTNLWSGLEEALKTKSLVYGDRYETNVDEIFILSDGAPSVGEVLDPVEILRLVKEANRFAQMRINTIFISSEDPEEERRNGGAPWMGKVKPEELMRRLAEENGGKCVIL